MQAEGEATENRVLHAVNGVRDPDHAHALLIQQLIEPAFVMDFSVQVPGGSGVEQVVGLIHDDDRALAPVGDVETGHDAGPISAGKIISRCGLEDLIGVHRQFLHQAAGEGSLSSARRAIKQHVRRRGTPLA